MRWAMGWCEDIRRLAGAGGRSLDVFVDAVAARKDVCRLREVAGGQTCAF